MHPSKPFRQKFLPHSASVQGGSRNFYILKISSYFTHTPAIPTFKEAVSELYWKYSQRKLLKMKKKVVLMLQLGVSRVAIYDLRSFKSPLRDTGTHGWHHHTLWEGLCDLGRARGQGASSRHVVTVVRHIARRALRQSLSANLLFFRRENEAQRD